MGRLAVASSRVKNAIGTVLPRGRIARSVGVLAGGTALGQLITVLVSPILTRLYAPSDFGVLAVYSSILGVLSVMASMRYEFAIPLPERDEEAISVVLLCLGIVALVSLLASVVLWRVGQQILILINVSALIPHLWLLPLGVVTVGSYQVFNYWAVRKQSFGRIARTKITQGIGSACTQVGLGLLGAGVTGLIIGQIVGQCAGMGALLRYFWMHSRQGLGKAANIAIIKSLAIRYRRFPQFSVVAAVLNAIGLQLTIIALNVLHGAEVTGWYALSQKVLGVPLSLLNTATAQVTLGEAAARRRMGRGLNKLFWRLVRQQALLGVPIIALAPLCPYLFGLIFGSRWTQAGVYAAIWLPALIMGFIASPTGGFLEVLERQGLALVRELCRIALVGSAFGLCAVLRPSPWQTVALFSATNVLFYLVYCAFSWVAVRRYSDE